jgi:hypothetical protein
MIEIHRVDVYLNDNHRDKFFGLNVVFDQRGKHEVSRAHALVPAFTFWTTALVHEIPYLAWFTFNVGDDPDFTEGNPQPLALAYRRAGNPSLSVGDVLCIDDGAYLSCERDGWRERSADELLITEDGPANGGMEE